MIDFAQPLDGMNTLVIGGGGNGIGGAISRALAAAGSAVAVADIDPARARDAAQELAEAGARAVALVGDVRSRSDIDGFVAQVGAELGGLDTLVTVVGGQVAFVPAVRLHEMSDDDWDLAYEMNLRYVVRAARAAIRSFLAGDGIRMNVVACGAVATPAASSAQQAGEAPRSRWAGSAFPATRLRRLSTWPRRSRPM